MFWEYPHLKKGHKKKSFSNLKKNNNYILLPKSFFTLFLNGGIEWWLIFYILQPNQFIFILANVYVWLGACTIKLIKAVIYSFRNKLE